MKSVHIFGLVLATACWMAFCGNSVAGQELAPTEPQVTAPDSPPAPAATPPLDQGGTTGRTAFPGRFQERETGPRFPWLSRLGLFSREHTVTTPRGQMTHTWEGSKTDAGYSLSRQQTWTTPDGTLLRQHEASITGTDPLNFEREKTITLRDGRTIEHTYSQSWDGQTLQRERTFTGPNGQTRTNQQTLSRDGEGDPPDGNQPTMSGTPASPPPEVPRPPEMRPRGFTLGSSARGNWGSAGNGAARRQASEPESAPVKARRTRMEHSQQLADQQPDRGPRPHPGPRR